MPEPWVVLLVSAVTGGLMGAILTLLYNRATAKQAAHLKEQATIDALAGELRSSILLCEYNANLRQNATAPFVQFSTTVATDVTFGQRHSYPLLDPLQPRLEAYALALIHVNQLIDLHNLLWTSTESPSGVSPGAPGRREELRFQIADICSGNFKLKGVGPEGFLVLPTFVNVVAEDLADIAN